MTKRVVTSARWPRLAHAVRHRLGHALRPHSHEPAAGMDASAEGIRALWVSLGALATTAAAQGVVAMLSGSVALLGDTVHNAGDALTAAPLGLAFLLGRRPATRAYTYGFGRAEDLAGVVVLLVVAASAGVTAVTSASRLARPASVSHLPALACAALIGFAGNEWVARYRIRAGRRIGSVALVADGQHARADGLTSLAVLLGAGGAALGWRLADPLVGLAITAAILAALGATARQVLRRLMDAVDPALLDAAESAIRATPGVLDLGELRMRWVGCRLRGEARIVVDGALTVQAAHQLAVAAEHAMRRAVPRLAGALIHADPSPAAGARLT